MKRPSIFLRRGFFLLAPGLLAAVVALGLRWQPLSSPDTACALELTVTSETTHEVSLRFNPGDGWNFANARALWLHAGLEPQTHRIKLPSGDFKFFELLSLEADKTQHLLGARVVDEAGGTLAKARMPPDAAAGALNIFVLEHGLRLTGPGHRTWGATLWEFALCALLFGLLAGLMARQPGARARVVAGLRGGRRWLAAHPRTTLLAAAALAVAVSCHPVLFFGKSFVSPNNGTLCLYDAQPTLPGATSTRVEEWSNSDVYAVFWAHLPYSVITHRAVFGDGAPPLWNRYNLCGVTLLGQGQAMAGDPLFWIPVAANGAAWAWDARFILAKMLFAFGIGLLVWRTARGLGVAVLLAASSAFIGFFSFRFDHAAFFSVCWSPWILLCWVGAARAATARGLAGCALGVLAANWLELNSGTAKEAGMLLVGMNAVGGLAVLLGHETWRRRGRRLAVMAAGCALFLAVSAPLWGVFLEALRHGYTGYDVPATCQLSPGLLLGLFDDLFYREVMLNELHIAPSLNFLVLLGVLWALAEIRRVRAEPVVLAAALLALPLLALVFGVVPPEWLNAIPFVKNILHVDNTFTCVLLVPAFLVAGCGLRGCVEKMRARAAWCAAWRRTLLGAAGLTALYFGTIQAVPRYESFALGLRRPVILTAFFTSYVPVLLAGLVLLPWLARCWVCGRRGRGAAALGAGLCLVAFHFRQGMWLETKFDTYVMNPQPRVDLQAHSPAVDFVLGRQAEPGRVTGFGKILRPGFNAVFGLESPIGSDAVLTPFYAEWFAAFGLDPAMVWSLEPTKKMLAPLRPFFDAMNVRYYFGSLADAAEPAPGLQKVAAADLEVFESETAWPRAFFTDRVLTYREPRELAAWIRGGDGRPFAAVQNGEPGVPALPAKQLGRQLAAGRDYRLTANATAFTIDAAGPGLAVLNEAFVTDGFRARINGRPAPILRVNHIFKAVALPAAGTYRIEFEYWPRVLTPALWVSLGGLLTTLGAALWLLRRRADAAEAGTIPAELAATADLSTHPMKPRSRTRAAARFFRRQ